MSALQERTEVVLQFNRHSHAERAETITSVARRAKLTADFEWFAEGTAVTCTTGVTRNICLQKPEERQETEIRIFETVMDDGMAVAFSVVIARHFRGLSIRGYRIDSLGHVEHLR